MVRGSSALSCESCGHLNDLRMVERIGLERTMTCEKCAHVERWRIGSGEGSWSFTRAALASPDAVIDRPFEV